MYPSRYLRLPLLRKTPLIYVACVLLIASAVGFSLRHRRRAWSAAETPVTFWAWRNEAPAGTDVREAIEQTKARAIFLRAGQIDFRDGKPGRIRRLTGPLPHSIDLHLVYNATRSLLEEMERVDENALAETIRAAYREEAAGAALQQARVIGLQVDIDVPTRLLSRYGRVLRALRAHLEPGTRLSITGLPTWMESPELSVTLQQVDFWIPQLYGAEIPERLDQSIPISSVSSVSRFVNQARQLDKPFYAGLAAYSYALLYSSSGSLITLRGDLNPVAIALDQNLELINQRPFESKDSAAGGSHTSSDWRYVYRAKTEGVIDGLSLRAGEVLVVDMPSAEALRASARVVRAQAGEQLLGICVFRLPSVTDPATLNIAQITAALSDLDSPAKVEVKILRDTRRSSGEQGTREDWILEVKNTGIAGSTIDSTRIDLRTRPESIESLTPPTSAAFESLCGPAAATNQSDLEPCSLRRANVIRLAPRILIPGQTLRARLVMNPGSALTVPVSIEMQTDSGESYHAQLDVAVESNPEQ